jgi:hypothetical protein
MLKYKLLMIFLYHHVRDNWLNFLVWQVIIESFAKNFSIIAEQLTNFLTNSIKFVWSNEQWASDFIWKI